VSLLLLSRFVLLFAGIDAIYFDEELTTGLIGKDLIEGLRTSFFDYQLAAHHAGSLLMGIAVAPLFLLFGERLMVLKLAPLMVYAGAMALWFRTCDRYFGRRVAVTVSLLFICSPQLLSRFSLITVGFHPESIIFTAAATFLLFRIVVDGEKRAEWFIALGFVCGLGFCFAYIFIPTVATSVLFWFLADPKFPFRKSFLVFVSGFLVGASPWIYFNATHSWGGLRWLVM
jgi:4-amino-4-deoxy-L-arabinose transferase-like glycosyltransferase